MSKSKEYKAVKNFLHNELQISREMIVDIVKDEVKSIVLKTIRNTYGANDIESVVKQTLRWEIVGARQDVLWAFENEVRKMMSEIVKKEFEVSIVQKVNSKLENNETYRSSNGTELLPIYSSDE
ncbi:hypothetical protein K140096H11_30230 [Bacteroides intestinalis]|uniref:Uncharacterized protein n=1 Tax=Bacteroides intestinalis TaxID=329854 RepID=A0A6N2XJY9_9BACE|nr:hypothetical protein [Bacteroides intestinalis]DAN80204.1 MAG TPA: hypothetical protein [Caudoviricetes sp.]